MWNLTAGGREGILFIFLQAKLRTAKQTKIGTASITDSAAVQQLDCNSHLCSTFPDEFLPDPVGQWWQTLFSDVKHFFKAWVSVPSASSNMCFYQCWQQCQLLSIIALESFLDPDDFQITLDTK